MDELELLKKEVADLKTANQVLTDKVKVAEQQEINSEIEAAKAKVTDLEKTVSDMQKTIDELKNVISLKDADNTKAAEKVETLTKELETAKSELNTIKVETEKKTRAAKLKEAGVSDEDASKIVDQFITADVALFDTVVAAYQTRKPAEPEQKEKDVKITEDDVEKTQAGVVSDGVDDASLQKTKAAVFTFLQNNLSKGK
jgi:chromosome segregation ATPase